MANQSVHLHPRISANKLSEYVVSPPLRRQHILENQKYSCDPFDADHQLARTAIVDLILGTHTRAGFLRRTEEIISGPHASSYGMYRAHNCAEAMLRFLDLEPHLDLRGMTPRFHTIHDKIDVDGVTVNVSPDLILEGPSIVGALKLCFVKHPQTAATAEYVATLLRMQLAMTNHNEVCEEACIVINVFANQVRTAPRSYQKRWRDIEAACFDIRRAWPTI